MKNTDFHQSGFAPTQILCELEALGLRFAFRDGRLRVSPKELITSEIHELLKREKQSLIGAVTGLCPICNESLLTTQGQTYVWLQCPSDFLHYSELLRKRIHAELNLSSYSREYGKPCLDCHWPGATYDGLCVVCLKYHREQNSVVQIASGRSTWKSRRQSR